MSRSPTAAYPALMLMSLTAATAPGATVDFESVPLPHVFGIAQGDDPGDLVLAQDRIEMRLAELVVGSRRDFIEAEIGGAFDVDFATTPLSLDTIGVVFDFSNVGFDVTQVTFEYLDLGGFSNFAVNGHTLFELLRLDGIPTDVAPGVEAIVDDDLITLTGAITSFLVGGQELGIDNVTAVPEPATLAFLSIGGIYLLTSRRRRPRT